MADLKSKHTTHATTEPSAATPSTRPGQIDISEKGRDSDGKQISLQRRLFMQFTAWRGPGQLEPLLGELSSQQPQVVLYRNANDPRGVGLLAFCEDPAYLIDGLQPMLNTEPFNRWELLPRFTMLGRTYSIGYESDLEDVLIHRPIQRICDPGTPWAVWYPVRRSGAFDRQPADEQRKMLMEHGGIGHAYGKAGYATDIRLAGHGLNPDDHDFIVGLIGQQLFPLSALVQHMRRTRQTSEFIQSMGPFFVGRRIWKPDSSGHPLHQ